MSYSLSPTRSTMLALVIANLTCTGLAADASAVGNGGRGWSEKIVNLIVKVLPAERTMTVHGDATLAREGAPAGDVIFWLNYGRYSKNPVMKFVALQGPAGSTAEINQTDPAHPGTFFATIHLEKPVLAGRQINVTFDVESLRGNAFTLTIDSPVSVVDESNGWYPMALADDGVLDADRERAIGATTFVLPSGFHAVSNGVKMQSQAATQANVENWHLEVPGTRSFAVGPYSIAKRRAGKTLLETYTLTGTDPVPRLNDLVNVLSVLQSEYGAFPYPRYSLAEVPDKEVNWYGLASREMTVERTSIFRRSDALGYLAHEAGHAWWGNLVGQTGPGGLMMNEGLAQFSAATVVERMKGRQVYLDGLNRGADGSFYSAEGYFRNFFGRAKDKPLSRLDISRQDDYDLAIAKGIWIYHMLREAVGDKLFFSTLRGLIREYGGREIRLAALRSAFLKAAPRAASLAVFFRQWLDQRGAPIVSSSALGLGRIAIRQWQHGAPYRLRFLIVVHCQSGDFAQMVAIASRMQTVRLKQSCAPSSVDLDPESSVLMWRTSYGPAPPPG